MRYGQREHRNDCSPAFDTGDSLPAYVTGDSLPRSTPNDWKYSRLQVTARQSSPDAQALAQKLTPQVARLPLPMPCSHETSAPTALPADCRY